MNNKTSDEDPSPTSTATCFFPKEHRDGVMAAGTRTDFNIVGNDSNDQQQQPSSHISTSEETIISKPDVALEEFDFQSFRAKLERNVEISKIVVNLDDHFKQQRIKKLMDLKKKNEAANFLQSYHASLATSRQIIAGHSSSILSPSSTSKAQNEKCDVKNGKQSGCVEDQKCERMSVDDCIDSVLVNVNKGGCEGIEGISLDEDNTCRQIETKNIKLGLEKDVPEDCYDMYEKSNMALHKDLLLPPKRDFIKIFQLCWCSE